MRCLSRGSAGHKFIVKILLRENDMTVGGRASELRRACSRLAEIRRDNEIPPMKAIEDLTSCIESLRRGNDRFSFAETLAIRGTAFARGMEDHESAFKDWRQALRIIPSTPEEGRSALRLAGSI